MVSLMMDPACSEARKSARSAISSGFPNLLLLAGIPRGEAPMNGDLRFIARLYLRRHFFAISSTICPACWIKLGLVIGANRRR